MKGSKIYNVGIYIRLSREDEDKNKIESESISNQRNIILDYINKQSENFKIYDEYIDDGYSGTTFDRPSFNRLIKDIENGKVNCVITKDYSRLGRDYIKAGEYMEKYFPEHNVRYIAILDDIDTYLDSVSNDIAPFKAVFNDQYAKDTSKKVRRSLRNKKEQGLFLGWKAVYGYKLDENDRYKLVIDEEVAPIVRRIFKMAYDGMSCKVIADTLSKEKIPIPSVYANLNRGKKSSAYGLWCSRTIDEMLNNETYIGNLTQGRRKTINYKIKKEIRTPKDSWIVIPNSHEPIIDKEMFEVVQQIYKKNKNLQNNSKNYLLRGFLYCKECGHAISISTRTENRAYTGCSYYQKFSKFKVCTPHTMNYYDLEKAVLKEIREMCKKYIDSTNFENLLKNSSKRNKAKENLQGQINACKLNIEKLNKRKNKIYFDKVDEIISLEEYREFNNQIVNDIIKDNEKIKSLENELAILENKINPNNDYTSIVKDYLKLRKPSKRLLACIIDKIIISQDKQITIKYRIKDPKLLLDNISTNESA
ncbi:MAG: recombinase family protein [Bacilli bacterium]|nr:recombinase family protein [Bacilli bacterium]